MDAAPFISLAWNGNDCQVEGQHACEFGHRISRPGSAHADGIFCGWHWDGNRLLVYNDRYGMFPLFYCQVGNRLLVSPSLTTLLARGASMDMDHTSLYLFLRLGVYVAERTPFEHIRAVPPAATFSWRQGVLSLAGRYARVPTQSLSRKDAVDGFITLFRQAIARRTPADGHYAVPLSGGRDSRFILLELWNQGHRDPFCITARRSHYPRDPNVDIAGALTRRLGLQHVVVDPPASPVAAEREKNLRTHLCAAEHEWYLPIAARLESGFQSVYDGIAGDITTDILGHGESTADTSRRYEAGDLDGVSRELFDGMANTMGLLLTPTVFSRFDESKARHLLHEELERHAGAPNPVASFFFWNRTRRAVALIPYGLLSGLSLVYSPYLDHDLFDFFTSLPWRSVADNQLRSETIRRAYPDFADLPFDDDPPVARPSEHALRRLNTRYARELLGLMIKHRTPRPWLARRAPVLSLLAGAAASGTIATHYAWLFDRLVYLLQIEELVARSDHA